MAIIVEPTRTLGVEMQPSIVRHLQSGRIRAGVWPVARMESLKEGDALWLREGINVDERRSSAQSLALRYFGDCRVYEVPWPRTHARPAPGLRPADAMPVHASRYTLVVRSNSVIRLSGLDEESAIACGAEYGFGGGFVPVGAGPDFEPFGSAADAIRFLWDSRFGDGAAAKNPEVCLIHFRALARNIATLVPGLGKGGVR